MKLQQVFRILEFKILIIGYSKIFYCAFSLRNEISLLNRYNNIPASKFYYFKEELLKVFVGYKIMNIIKNNIDNQLDATVTGY